MEAAALIEKFGLAIGLLIYFIWRDYQTSREHKADLKDIANKSVQAIDKGTEAIRDGIEVAEKSNKIIGENSNILNRVKGVLSVRKDSHDGSGNGN